MLTIRIRLFLFLFFAVPFTWGMPDFSMLNKNREIITSPGVDVFTKGSLAGKLVPLPKSIILNKSMVKLDGCAILVSISASPTEKSAAGELARQIAASTGKAAPLVVTKDPGIGTVFRLEVSAGSASKLRPEGYRVTSRNKAGRDIVRLYGNDRFGVYWGVQALKQLLVKYNGKLPHLSMNDWPDTEYRGCELRSGMAQEEELEQLVRLGRLNFVRMPLCWFHHLRPIEQLKKLADRYHHHGVLCEMYIGWHLNIAPLLKKEKNICGLEIRNYILKAAEHAFKSGCDIFTLKFDDIWAGSIGNIRNCTVCDGKCRKKPVEMQIWLIRELLSYCRKHDWGPNKKLFVICPTLYWGNIAKKYAKIPDLSSEKAYFKYFCEFPDSKELLFYHCNFTRKSRLETQKAGLVNFAWWNNGPWAAASPEIFGAHIAMPRMGYSWGMIEGWNTNKGIERFRFDQLNELPYLAGKTDFVCSSTPFFIGQALGGLFSWNMTHYLKNEQSFQKFIIDNLYRDCSAYKHFLAWEKAAKPLYLRSIRGDFSHLDTAKLLKQAKDACEKLQSLTRNWEKSNSFGPPDAQYRYSPVQLKFELDKLREIVAVQQRITEIKNINSDVVRIGKHSFRKTSGPSMKKCLFDKKTALLFNGNIVEAKVPEFNFSKQSFHLDCEFILFSIANSQGLVRTRKNFIFWEVGDRPGWGLGILVGKAVFTLEDIGDITSYLITRRIITVYKPYKLRIIRDFTKRKITIYVNGKLITSCQERGNGDFGKSTDKIYIGQLSGLLTTLEVKPGLPNEGL